MKQSWRLLAGSGIILILLGLLITLVFTNAPQYRDPDGYCRFGNGPKLTQTELVEHGINPDSLQRGMIRIWPVPTATCFWPVEGKPLIHSKEAPIPALFAGVAPFYLGLILVTATGVKVTLTRKPLPPL